MKIILRPVQFKNKREIGERFREGYLSVLLRAPCGYGKTVLVADIMKDIAARGQVVWFCVHQQELITQTSATLRKFGIKHGIVASGARRTHDFIQLCMINTLKNRAGRMTPPRWIIYDEAHRSVSKTYQDLRSQFPEARLIGLTATPKRTDGRGLNELYQVMVDGPTEAELIKLGFLSDYRLIAPQLVSEDTSGLARGRDGDFTAEAAASVITKRVVSDAVDAYKTHAYGRRCVVMCPSVERAYEIAKVYTERGIRAECIEGSLEDHERKAIIERFRTGETKVITNVQLLVVGVDIPAIQCVQWLRITDSVIVWVQGNGRGMRPAEGKRHCIILDHVENWRRHGPPDEEREWSLEAAKKRPKDEVEALPKTVRCPVCYSVQKLAGLKSAGEPNKYRCGAPLLNCDGIIELAAKPRNGPVQEKGELVEIDKQAALRLRKLEQAAAKTLTELVRLGKAKGYKDPAAWACKVYAGRFKRKLTPEEYTEAYRAKREEVELGL